MLAYLRDQPIPSGQCGLLSDQRGWRRPIGAHCDIGAFEYSPYALALPIIRR